MADYAIYQGGNYSSTDYRMFPSATNPNATNGTHGVYSYADHQRARLYSVTRLVDVRSTVASGTNRDGKDEALNCFLRDKIFAVGDVLQTHLLIPNSVIMGVSAYYMGGPTGLEFEIVSQGDDPYVLGTLNAASKTNSTLTSRPKAVWFSQAAVIAASAKDGFIEGESTMGLQIKALPTTGGANALNDLFVALTVHVLDLDNGNA